MFTDDNTEGYPKVVLDAMNRDFYEEMKQYDLTQMSYADYAEAEKRVSEEILKKYDAQLCDVINYFFGA